jgi:hypothetical protein
MALHRTADRTPLRGRGVIGASTESFHLAREQRYRRGEFSPEANYHDSFGDGTLRRVLPGAGLEESRRFAGAVSQGK